MPEVQTLSAESAVDEHHVRRLLSAARRADPMRGDTLAHDLQTVTGSSNVSEALKKLADLTFKDLGHMGSRLSELIVKSDLDGTLSFTEVASTMGLSLRQFFRYRARAVQMLAEQLRTLLHQSSEPMDALGSLFDTLVDWNPDGALDVYSVASRASGDFESFRALKAFVETAREIPAALFERVQKQYASIAFAVRAQQRCLFGDASGAEEDVRRAETSLRSTAETAMRRALSRETAHVRFLLARSAGSLGQLQRTLRPSNEGIEFALGDAVDALEGWCAADDVANVERALRSCMAVAQRLHDVPASVRLCIISAVTLALGGDLRRARQLAGAAHIAAEHHVWLSAEAWILDRRIALLSGAANAEPDAYASLPQGSWHRTFVDSVLARQLLAQRRLMECASLGRECAAAAAERGYGALAAYNDCTLAAVDGLEDRRDQERERYQRAWAWYVRSRDAVIALDLFTPPHAMWRDVGVFEFADLGIDASQLAHDREFTVAMPLADRAAARL